MGVPGFEKLPLECALDDPPQLRTLAKVFSEDVATQHEYLATLHRLTSRLVTNLDDVTQAYQALALHLNAYSSKVYAVNTDPLQLIDATTSRCAQLLHDVSCRQHLLCQQVTDGVLHPLTQQLNAQSQLLQLQEQHAQATLTLEAAVAGLLRLRRRDAAAEAAVADARRRFHQCAVLYYSELNLHQAGRQLTVLTPLLSLVAAHQCHHALAHAALNAAAGKRHVSLLKEVMKHRENEEANKEKKPKEDEEEKFEEIGSKEELDAKTTEKEENDEKSQDTPLASDKSPEKTQNPALADEKPKSQTQTPAKGGDTAPLRIPKKNDEDFFEALGLVVKKLELEHEMESTACSDLIGALLEHSESLYHPSAASAVHAHQSTALHGYLYINRRYMGGVVSTWERVYAFVEGGHLMGVGRGGLGGAPLLPLDPDTSCRTDDTDDRLHVFVVTCGGRSVTLQALTAAERDIWMAGLERAGREGGYVRGPAASGGGGSGLPSPSSAPTIGPPSASTFLSSMGQFLSSKLPASLAGAAGGGGTSPYSLPRPSRPSPLGERDTRREVGGGGAISSNAPIVFDLGPLQGVGGGSAPHTPPAGEGQSFDAAFLGSMPVNVATSAATVISEVMRRVMSARAHHNLFSSTPVVITVASPHLTVTARQDLAEPRAGYRQRHRLTALTGWAAHRENPRLFGYVVRGVSSLQCFVFQCDEDASRICRAITIADDPNAREKETSLILANIAQLEDDPPGQGGGPPEGPPPPAGELEDEEALEEFDNLTADQIAEMEAEMGDFVIE